jgi:hypothetical protein
MGYHGANGDGGPAIAASTGGPAIAASTGGPAIAASTGGPARFYFCPKPTRSERDAGLAEMADTLRHRVNPGGLEHDPRWAPVSVKNDHNCVKPIDLLRYLATMLLPPPRADGQPRRILVPFCGSGSETIGALLAGWDSVTGIEQDARFVDIARGRMAHHAAQLMKEPHAARTLHPGSPRRAAPVRPG